MAVEAVIGKTFTFQTLFVDAQNDPIAVESPTVSVFSYSQSGVKQFLAAGVPLVPATPAETGRYTYTVTIPTTLDDGMALYAEMRATDVGTGDRLLTEQQITLVAPTRAGGNGGGGLRSRFMKGG